MTKEKLLEKLKELGIESTNAHPKSSFVSKGGIVCIGLYRSELDEDFYFYNNFDKKIYKLPKQDDVDSLEQENFQGAPKYLVPMNEAELVWEDKPYEEKADDLISRMTVRQFACIMMGIPDSGTPWLDQLIRSKPGPYHTVGTKQ